ncbi:MAG: G-D-S-L family lipolytic protein [Saprospiraceae bacterium]|nr:G-D-S-L family lipolytic protein [Saprospiraceae bacterium]
MKLHFLFLLLLCGLVTRAQDPLRFEKEIERIIDETSIKENPHTIFTGSSSVRMWRNVAETYPQYHVVNRGFGGSQMSDLLHYLDVLVLQSKPCQVFIYEGDNDISAGKSIGQIMKDAEKVCSRIGVASPNTEIVFISPKPSVARWQLKDQYVELNQALKSYAMEHENVKFADVWSPALGSDGVVLQDIFLEDNLHMNEKGYAIWGGSDPTILEALPIGELHLLIDFDLL